MFKVALSAGHYLKNARRCIAPLDPKETREWTLNARICEKIEKILADYEGIEVLRVDDRTGAKDISLPARASSANNWEADMYGAVHANAAKSDGKPHNASGIVVYVKEDASPETCKWQDAFYKALIEKTGLKGNRANPKPKKNLYEAYLPKMMSFVFELGFMDSPIDVPIILSDAFAENAAKAIATVIIEKSGATKKKNVSDTSTSSTTVSNCNVTVALPILTRGSKGEHVKLLQHLLNIHGCTDGKGKPLEIDGSFGSATRYALATFQSREELKTDCICGPATWAELLKIND